MKLAYYVPIFTVCIVANAFAEETYPAVSELNAKADFLTGASDGDVTSFIGLSGSIPLGQSYGLQVDTAIGKISNLTAGGVGGHVFWRNPEVMLLGVTGMWSRVEAASDSLERGGLEAEYYFDSFTVASSAGMQWDAKGNTSYASLGATYYYTPNIAVSSEVSGFSNKRSVKIGGEYRPESMDSSSFFVDTSVDNDNKLSGIVGVRFSFGAPSKTLRKRDRFDDPINIVSSMMSASASAVVEQTKKTETKVASGGSSGGGGIC